VTHLEKRADLAQIGRVVLGVDADHLMFHGCQVGRALQKALQAREGQGGQSAQESVERLPLGLQVRGVRGLQGAALEAAGRGEGGLLLADEVRRVLGLPRLLVGLLYLCWCGGLGWVWCGRGEGLVVRGARSLVHTGNSVGTCKVSCLRSS
jgi:hypothetical protein